MYSKIDAMTHTLHFISLLRQNGITVTEAFLFGSCARNVATEGSDIDVAVVSPDFSGFRFDDLGRIALCKLQSNNDLDVVPIAEKDFSLNDPFVKEIVATGVKVL
jgi:uncharacterized protein